MASMYSDSVRAFLRPIVPFLDDPDVTEVVTDFAEVTALNNKSFAPIWRRLTSPGDTFAWSPVPF